MIEHTMIQRPPGAGGGTREGAERESAAGRVY